MEKGMEVQDVKEVEDAAEQEKVKGESPAKETKKKSINITKTGSEHSFR